MGLQQAVARAFAADGALAQCVESFSPRGGQSAMAQAVATTLGDGGVLVVEAGTGVGKTFAYLVPALLSGVRVLVSTATKTLQDQLFRRDIPRLKAALGVPVRTALLKGRSAYLCQHRLGSARQDLRAAHPSAQEDLARIEQWSHTTRSGDLAELPQLDERSPVIALVTSTRENCLGAQCPQIHACHVNLARREAMAADLVVINHHLFFADMNIRESGVAELLPSVQAVVFDEAHQLNEIGVQFLGRQLTSTRLHGYVRDLKASCGLLTLASGDLPALVGELGDRVDALQQQFQGRVTNRQAWYGEHPQGVDAQSWAAAVSALHTALQQSETVLRGMEDFSPELKALRERASQLTAELDIFCHAIQPGWIRWVEVGSSVRLVQSPLDIAQAMHARMDTSATGQGHRKAWIFTSATLGHDETLAQFQESCGLQGAQVLQVQSPFDYAAQAALYVPGHLPKPAEAGHSKAVAELVAQGVSALGGRTLVLTTTLRAMRDIAEDLRSRFTSSSGVEVLLQGESPKQELTERFRSGADGPAQGYVLVASLSFWEGVDVPGDALQMVVIDKLPFSPPDDPLVEARSQQIKDKGGNPFKHLHVPQAAIALKQGAGRLIRRESDRGVLVVCDTRLVTMGYGRRIMAALPAMRTISGQEEFAAVLDGLTRPSTTAHW